MPELAEVELSRRVWSVAEGLALTGMCGHPKTRIYRDCSLARLQRGLGAPFYPEVVRMESGCFLNSAAVRRARVAGWNYTLGWRVV